MEHIILLASFLGAESVKELKEVFDVISTMGGK